MKNGFTLVETMIAIAIIAIAIAGPVYSASRSLLSAQVASDHLTASGLAQEGIEYIRAMRDDAFLNTRTGGQNENGDAWADFLGNAHSWSSGSCQTPALCSFSPDKALGVGSGLALTVCPGGTCPRLYYAGDGTYFYYTTDSTAPRAVISPFTRSVKLIPVSSTEEQVIVQVSWTFHGVPFTVVATDHLTPWQ